VGKNSALFPPASDEWSTSHQLGSHSGDAVSGFAHLAPAGVCQVAEPPRRYHSGNMDNRNATTCTRPWVVCSSTIR
jgi:hypothetical protein